MSFVSLLPEGAGGTVIGMKRASEREERLGSPPPIRRKKGLPGLFRGLVPGLLLAVAFAWGFLGSLTLADAPMRAGSDLAEAVLSVPQVEDGQLERGASLECCRANGVCHPGSATAVLSFVFQAPHPRKWPFSAARPERPGIVDPRFRPPRLQAHA